MNRRPSYASVAGGGSSSAPSQTPSARSGAFSHLMDPASQTAASYAANQEVEYRPSSGNPQGGSYDGARGGTWPSVQASWGKGHNTTSNYWDQPFPSSHDVTTLDRERLVRPSYLRRSRYMEKLEAAHKARLDAEREAGLALQQTSKSGSLSTSSSSVSLQRMAPSHRGMTYEIVETPPHRGDDAIPSLPSLWKDLDKGLEVSADGLDLRCSNAMKAQDHEAASARTDYPMPTQCGLYYYEVSIITKGKEGMVGVGFSGSKAELNKLPGWEQDSWAYHGDDGKTFCCQIAGKSYGSTFTAGDVVGCGVNFRNSTAFFTKNGVPQGVAFKDVKSINLYPSIGMKRPGTQVKVNFGQAPFMFDIDGFMVRETAKARSDIDSTDISILRPQSDESSLIRELVAQFLRHDGYVDTAKAFAEEMRTEAKALDKNHQELASDFELQEDIEAVHRQRIRSAILEGNIEKALKQTHVYYPHVLSDNPDILFHLRCRKFVEMMRLCTESFTSPSRNKSTNGHSSHSDGFGQDMELDEPVKIRDEWDHMETEDADYRSMGSVERMNETLRYGKELQQDYKDDLGKEQALKDIFALFAYEDPRNSPTAQVMDSSGRVPVAEELNSAILVGLGKSSSAAIERVYQQTDVLVGEITEQGGPGAFVNLESDMR